MKQLNFKFSFDIDFSFILCMSSIQAWARLCSWTNGWALEEAVQHSQNTWGLATRSRMCLICDPLFQRLWLGVSLQRPRLETPFPQPCPPERRALACVWIKRWDTHAYAMQTPWEAVSSARAFVKLTTRVQTGKDQLHHWSFFLRMHAKWNASSIIFNAHTAVGVQGDGDFFTMSGQCLIGRVVNDLLDDVQWIIGAGVHSWSLLHRLEAF